MSRIPVGCQMYTLREEMAKDFIGTLRRVAEIGYEGVQLSGVFGGFSGSEIKTILEDFDLKIAATHCSLDALEKDLSKEIDFHLALGNTRTAIGSLPERFRQDKAGYLAAAELMDRIGGEMKRQGVELGYHNHAFEFETKFDGECAYDVFFGAMDPENVKAELDTYWVQFGGQDPAAYVRKYASRLTLLHLKDMTAGENPTYAEVGEGILDWDAIFAAASDTACAWYLVEQDTCQRPPIESVALSFENLRKRGMV